MTTTPFTFEPLLPGRILAGGRYVVDHVLSSGGMGALVVALDAEHADGQVVIKGLLPYFDPADEGQVGAAIARLRREAAILATVHHPTVPRLVGEFAEGACPYVVMEYLSGENLLRGLTRTDPTTGVTAHGMGNAPKNVLRWAIVLCGTLAYLHAHPDGPILHQDIKPENVIVDRQVGRIWLVDFGSARFASDREPHTPGRAPPSIYGTPGYAPPEQYRGLTEPRSDVYALAATLYHVLSDDDPSTHPLSFPRLSALGPLGEALRAALDADVTRRPSAAQLRTRLLALVGGSLTLDAPDGTAIDGPLALAKWCEQHWAAGAAWLTGGLPEQIALWWDDERLAQALREIVARAPEADVALDDALPVLTPRRHAEQRHELTASDPAVYFGSVGPGERAVRDLRVRNAGQRTTVARVSAPAWVVAQPSSVVLAPGREVALTLVVHGAPVPHDVLRDGVIRIEAPGAPPLALPTRAWAVRYRLWTALVSLPVSVWRAAIIAVVLVIAVQIGLGQYQREQRYAAGAAALERGDWATARAEVASLGDSPDAVKLRKESYYRPAVAAAGDGEWDAAATEIVAMEGEWLDSSYGDLPHLLSSLAPLQEAVARQRAAGWQDGELHQVAALRPPTTTLSVAVSPDGRWVVAGTGGTSRMLTAWSMLSGTTGATQWLEGQPITASFAADAPLLVTTSYRGAADTVSLWRIAGGTFQLVKAFPGQAGALSPDASLLALTDPAGGAQVLSVGQEGEPAALDTGGRRVIAWGWSAEGRILAGQADDGALLLWRDRRSVPTVMRAGGKPDPPAMAHQALAFSPDGALVAVRSGESIDVWRVADGAHVWGLPASSAVQSLAWSPGLQVRAAMQSLAWSPDGRLLATVSTIVGRSDSNIGGILQLWRADTGALILTAEVDDEAAPALAWSRDGRTLVTGGSRIIQLWRP